MTKETALLAGLSDAGKDDKGNQLWIGTDEQWKLTVNLENKCPAYQCKETGVEGLLDEDGRKYCEWHFDKFSRE